MKINTKRPFLIAEIGINHNGSLKLAKKLILLAKKYNFDAVKFQKRAPEICIPDDQKNIIRASPWGDISYLNYKKKIELKISDYREIDRFCKTIKIQWFCSYFDIESQKVMKQFRLKYNKIASAMLTNTKLVESIAKEKKKTFISTGLGTYEDIKKVIKIFKKNKCPYILMHCVSLYPCPEEKLNLSLIEKLKTKFKCQIGYSGHESTVSPSIIAWLAGASVIERHITLDRSMWGTDQSASLGEEGISNLTSIINKADKIIGDGKKKLSKQEKKMLSKFKYWD